MPGHLVRARALDPEGAAAAAAAAVARFLFYF